MNTLSHNFSKVRAHIAKAVAQAGRPPESVKLLAVTKTFPVEDIQAAYDDHQRLFAENKVQEICTKAPLLPTDIEWHLIGPLQRNKVRKALNQCSWIHAVDSLRLAEYIDSVSSELSLRPNILFEINVGNENSKFGFSPEEIISAWPTLTKLQHISLKGLMCIPPPSNSIEEARTYFRSLRELKEKLEALGGISLPELSMGMSHDYEAAILEGATMIRIGTALFGGRDYTPKP